MEILQMGSGLLGRAFWVPTGGLEGRCGLCMDKFWARDSSPCGEREHENDQRGTLKDRPRTVSPLPECFCCLLCGAEGSCRQKKGRNLF